MRPLPIQWMYLILLPLLAASLVLDLVSDDYGIIDWPWMIGALWAAAFLGLNLVLTARADGRGRFEKGMARGTWGLILLLVVSTGVGHVLHNYEKFDDEVASGASPPPGFESAEFPIYVLAGATALWLVFRLASTLAHELGGRRLTYASCWIGGVGVYAAAMGLLIVGADPSAEDFLYLGGPVAILFTLVGGFLLALDGVLPRASAE